MASAPGIKLQISNKALSNVNVNAFKIRLLQVTLKSRLHIVFMISEWMYIDLFSYILRGISPLLISSEKRNLIRGYGCRSKRHKYSLIFLF